MSNHYGAVGSEKTKNYEIIRSHQAFTFGTVAVEISRRAERFSPNKKPKKFPVSLHAQF